jgi:diaminopimelate decarboxylase
VAYAIKANNAGSIVRTVASAGTGACLVSGAELMVAEGCGIAPTQMVLNGVGKQDWELDLAIQKGLLGIQAESIEELDRVTARALTAGKKARVGFRINPGVEIDSHSHIATGHDEAKFGIPKAEVSTAFARVDSHAQQLECVGLSTHVGSMLYQPDAYLESAGTVCEIAKGRLAAGHALKYVNFGGGFGVTYGEKDASAPTEFAKAAVALADRFGLDSLKIVVEPGRSMVGPHGVLIAKVIQTKEGKGRRWLMIDAGMNDLLRPALYAAHHRIEPVESPVGAQEWRVVGPICESSDDFGNHELGEAPKLVVIRDTGAYGFCMASQYNGRSLATEIFVREAEVVSISQSEGTEAWVTRRLQA